MLKDESFLIWAWREINGPQPGIVLRVALSLVGALVLFALALLAAWAWTQVVGGNHVGDAELAVAVFLAALVWVGFLVRIWRTAPPGSLLIAWTLCITVTVISACFIVSEVFRIREPEYVIGGLVSLGAAALILSWLPVVLRRWRGRPVVGPDNIVQVQCPTCGYSLVGLRELRCPECGTHFTLDEIIRAQNYGAAQPGSESRPGPFPSPSRPAPDPQPQARPAIEGLS